MSVTLILVLALGASLAVVAAQAMAIAHLRARYRTARDAADLGMVKLIDRYLEGGA